MLGRREVMRTKMMIGNPVYECLPSTAKSCARSGECHVMSWSSTLLHRGGSYPSCLLHWNTIRKLQSDKSYPDYRLVVTGENTEWCLTFPDSAMNSE